MKIISTNNNNQKPHYFISRLHSVAAKSNLPSREKSTKNSQQPSNIFRSHVPVLSSCCRLLCLHLALELPDTAKSDLARAAVAMDRQFPNSES